jgi:plastocyanin
MAPNLHYALGRPGHWRCCGAIPRVDIIHLHHGVWLSDGQLGVGETSGGSGNAYGGLYPFMATGEEKTKYILPAGFGYPVGAGDHWIFNYMIHNLWPQPSWVYVTYDVDWVPASTALAKTLTPVHPIWMDVMARHLYPVFNVLKGSGQNGKYTFPYMAKNPYGVGTPLNQFVIDHPGVLVATAAHVHPGGLYGELDITRAGAKKSKGAIAGIAPGSVRLFRSNAHYWDPRGPISWDMAMQGTAPDWRPSVRAGDILSVSATYETKIASWYESMGIMVVWEAWKSQMGLDVFSGHRQSHPMAMVVRALNPFAHALDQHGYLTHGHLAENDNHGGSYDVSGLKLNKLRSCAAGTSNVQIQNFNYNPGGFASTGKELCVPTIKAGQALTFTNDDAPTISGGVFPYGPNPLYVRSIFHTVTDCQNPCGLNTGISYPLANGPVNFDSGQLGFGTPASNTLTWSTPTGLKPGLYTYFCRIHPFMRGVFRVVG